jgi:hypothetical protein
MVKVRRQAERLIVTTTLVLAAFAAIGANLVVKSKIHLRLGSERYVAAHLPPRVDSIPGLLRRGDPDVSPLQDTEQTGSIRTHTLPSPFPARDRHVRFVCSFSPRALLWSGMAGISRLPDVAWAATYTRCAKAYPVSTSVLYLETSR